MKEYLKKTVAAAKGYFQRAALIVTHAETRVKAVVIAVIGGGASAVYNWMTGAGHFAFNAEKLVELKARFIYGSVVALAFWVMKSPDNTPKQPQ